MTKEDLKEYLMDIKNEIEDQDIDKRILSIQVRSGRSGNDPICTFMILAVGLIPKDIRSLILSRIESIINMDPNVILSLGVINRHNTRSPLGKEYTIIPDTGYPYRSWDDFRLISIEYEAIYSLEIQLSIKEPTIQKFDQFK